MMHLQRSNIPNWFVIPYLYYLKKCEYISLKTTVFIILILINVIVAFTLLIIDNFRVLISQ